MTRHLYRFYLYTVYIALLIFVTTATGRLLETLILLTPLRAQYENAPNQTTIVQAVVFALLAWGVTGVLGGLHYWLIRRDLRHDPTARNSAIRSFFLNFTEAWSMLIVTTVVGFVVIYGIGRYSIANAAGASLAILGLIAWLEVERRHAPITETRGIAIVFQRIHLYGVQTFLLFFLASAWFTAIGPLVSAMFFHSTVCQGSYGACDNLGNSLGSVLWFIVLWLGYGWLTTKDHARVPRFLMHGFGLAFGIGSGLIGIYQSLRVIIHLIAGQAVALQDVLSSYSPYNFVSPLTLGLFVTIIYFLWLRHAVRQGIIETAVAHFSQLAIAATISAFVFWSGWSLILYNVFEVLAAHTPELHEWITAIALVLTGIGYIPLDRLLRHGSLTIDTLGGPRRGLVFALLGIGSLALAIGGASALYAWITALLGSPFPGWDTFARHAVAAALIGAVLVALYLHSARKEQLFGHKSPPSPGIAEQAATIESVLDDLLSGKIDRDEAAKVLHGLYEHTHTAN